MTVRMKLAIGVVSIVALLFLGYAAMVIQTFPEQHARSCLATVTELADRTIDKDIPKQRFHEAIDAAKYIGSYYPPGAVLSKNHPFAAEYEARRQTQIRRIREALKEATGEHHPRIWQRWKSEVDANDTDASR